MEIDFLVQHYSYMLVAIPLLIDLVRDKKVPSFNQRPTPFYLLNNPTKFVSFSINIFKNILMFT